MKQIHNTEGQSVVVGSSRREKLQKDTWKLLRVIDVVTFLLVVLPNDYKHICQNVLSYILYMQFIYLTVINSYKIFKVLE